jgi:hypothetical protein
MRRQIKGLFNEPAVSVSSEPCANMRIVVSKNTDDCDIRERDEQVTLATASVRSKSNMVFSCKSKILSFVAL